jgi:hypothetical protein
LRRPIRSVARLRSIAVLREEISRVSRREVRKMTDGTRKASAQQRHHIVALKHQVAQLERLVAQLSRKSVATQKATSEGLPVSLTSWATAAPLIFDRRDGADHDLAAAVEDGPDMSQRRGSRVGRGRTRRYAAWRTGAGI